MTDHEQLADMAPGREKSAFFCPHCGAFSQMRWSHVTAHQTIFNEWNTAMCARCHFLSIWLDERMIYPVRQYGPLPAEDMPVDVLAIYNEAREVAPISKKSAAGLLRLALQMLVDGIEPGRGSIDDKIGKLVQKGLHPHAQQAMDVLRVAGNESVHPGQIDLEEDVDLLPGLFDLTNLIVEQVITRPKHVSHLFSRLPESKRRAIERRDNP